MPESQWSDLALREFIHGLGAVSWGDSLAESAHEAALARFRREVRERLVPGIQSRVLERVGCVVDPDGIALVALDVIDDLYCARDERRWLLASPSPWAYLESWIAAEVARAYKGASGVVRTDAKKLAKLRKELRSKEESEQE